MTEEYNDEIGGAFEMIDIEGEQEDEMGLIGDVVNGNVWKIRDNGFNEIICYVTEERFGDRIMEEITRSDRWYRFNQIIRHEYGMKMTEATANVVYGITEAIMMGEPYELHDRSLEENRIPHEIVDLLNKELEDGDPLLDMFVEPIAEETESGDAAKA